MTTTDEIIEKLKTIDEIGLGSPWQNWSLKEIKKLLKLYYSFCKNEGYLYELVYSFHGCDSWEDIFRDYNNDFLERKARGVKVALDDILEEEEDEFPISVDVD
jgi:hypothetical protein